MVTWGESLRVHVERFCPGCGVELAAGKAMCAPCFKESQVKLVENLTEVRWNRQFRPNYPDLYYADERG